MKLVLIPLAVAGFVGLSAFHGGCHSRSPEEKIGWFKEHAKEKIDDELDELDASDAQKAKVGAIADRTLDRGAEFYRGQEPAKQALIAEWEKPAVDRAKVHAIVDERVAALGGLLHDVADAVIGVHETLTPDQRAELSKDLPCSSR